MKDYKKLLRGC